MSPALSWYVRLQIMRTGKRRKPRQPVLKVTSRPRTAYAPARTVIFPPSLVTNSVWLLIAWLCMHTMLNRTPLHVLFLLGKETTSPANAHHMGPKNASRSRVLGMAGSAKIRAAILASARRMGPQNASRSRALGMAGSAKISAKKDTRPWMENAKVKHARLSAVECACILRVLDRCLSRTETRVVVSKIHCVNFFRLHHARRH